ncbi:MAG: SUMF1/EgtB/PvdO family nonheme iron enzyme, partial [Bacteroidota bacterium]
LDEIAWYRLNSGQHSHQVGQKEPNELGLYDMSGFIWEFCSDNYGPYPRKPITNPRGTSCGVNKVIRGGCLNDYKEMCRLTARRKFGPQFRDYFLGFRLAYTPE